MRRNTAPAPSAAPSTPAPSTELTSCDAVDFDQFVDPVASQLRHADDSVDKHVTSSACHMPDILGAVTAQHVRYTRDQLIALRRADVPTDTVRARVRQLFHHRGCRAGAQVKSRRRRTYHVSVVDDGGIPTIISNRPADRSY